MSDRQFRLTMIALCSALFCVMTSASLEMIRSALELPFESGIGKARDILMMLVMPPMYVFAVSVAYSIFRGKP